MDADVTVVGAGPVGLMLAGELAMRGVAVQVLERRVEPDETIKAGAINVPTAEALYRRGLLPAAAAAQQRRFEEVAAFFTAATETETPPAMPRKAGHFAAIMLDRDLVDPTDPRLGGHGPADDVVLVHQADVEELLARWVDELGVPVRRGVAVTGIEPGPDRVTVHTTEGPVEAGWLVGCDGGRSVVRRAAGFDFPGTDPEVTGHQAVVDIADREKLAVGWHRTSTGVYAYGPVPGRILTVEFTDRAPDRDAPVTVDELQASLRSVSGTDVTVTAVHTATRWTDNARQASTYRRDRVLLAGDAAHVHSPFGGQGLNLGIGDAVNLGWKLAATVSGDAPDHLLDTYTAERHPVGAWVLEWTRAQVALMRPDPKTDALRTVVGDLMSTPEGMTHIVAKTSGVDHRYALPGDHPLVGRSAPDLAFDDGSRLGEHLRSGRFVLVEPGGKDIDDRGGRLVVVTARCPDRPELGGLLVRPDGVVAWAADRDTEHRPDDSVAVLRRWCGEAVVTVAG